MIILSSMETWISRNIKKKRIEVSSELREAAKMKGWNPHCEWVGIPTEFDL